MNNKFKSFLAISAFVYVSFQYGNIAKSLVTDATKASIDSYLSIKDYIKNSIKEHFDQQDEIIKLRKENKELETSATLSIAFAEKLNSFLEDKNSSKYKPKIELVQVLNYVNLSDYGRVWIKFKDFNKSKIYGLIRKGVTSGIVVSQNNRALGLLQNDNKCIFSVYVGNEKIPGVAMGGKPNINIKYIPQWMSPKIGDEVRTSGLDKIFFGGVPVGKVIKVLQEDSYQTAIVEPYAKPQVPAFYYIVKEP